MRYQTPEALGMAVTAAARASEMDTGRAFSGFFFHRLLCRVFSRPDAPFLLKGGQSMLARTPFARATRDIDLLSENEDLNAAIEELKALAATDLGDFITFEFVKATPIKASDEYRKGARLFFIPLLGRRRLQGISVDLVVDQISCAEPELVTPADRIDIEGIPVFDYRIYPLVNSIADKLCAIIETHDGHPSSRVKDLVDLLLYATSVDIGGAELCEWVQLEARVRGLVLPSYFCIPKTWHEHYEISFQNMLKGRKLPARASTLSEAETLIAKFMNPVLDKSAQHWQWKHETLSWIASS